MKTFIHHVCGKIYTILYLSKQILQTKDQYYSHLEVVSQRGDWKSWLQYSKP